jgi:hypothetical protein
MADGELTLQLNAALSRRLEAAATEARQDVREYVEALIEDVLDAEGTDEDWAEDERRWAEFERTGHSIPAEVVLAEFKAAVARSFASKR